MKLKYKIIRKLNTLSATEWDLLLYAIKRADQDTGIAYGVYYRDVIKDTGMCKQSFYNALWGLVKKGVIRVTRASDLDYDICVLDNGFPDHDWSEGYVKLSREVFHSKNFKKLKAHEKYLLMEFLKGTHENGHSMCIGVEKFYQKFQEILGVTRRVIREYLHNLKKFFSIGIKDGKYYITYLHSVFEDKERRGKAERSWHLEQFVRAECHRQHITYDEKALTETAYLPVQYQACGKKDWLLSVLKACISKSAEGIRFKDRTLKDKYTCKTGTGYSRWFYGPVGQALNP